MNIRPVFACAAMCLIGCSDPALEVAPANDAGGDSGQGETAASDGGVETSDDAPAETSAVDSGVDVDADAADVATGVGLPCTNMEQCAAFGLACISHEVAGCTDAPCVRRYTCEAHPPSDKCTDTMDCVDIHCVTRADCPSGSNFCVGVVVTDSGAPLVAPYGNVRGLLTSRCSAGTPAAEPAVSGFSNDVNVYVCTSSGDCIMGDGSIGTCCATSVGISYCASTCTIR